MQTLLDEHGRLRPRVATARLVTIPLVVGVVAFVLVGPALGFDTSTWVLALSAVGLALTATAIACRAVLPGGWSNSRQFGDPGAPRRLRRAIRRGTTDGLSDADLRVAARFADLEQDAVLLSAVSTAGVAMSVAMNQLGQVQNDSSLVVVAIVLVIAGSGILVASVLTAIVQTRRCRRFAATVRAR